MMPYFPNLIGTRLYSIRLCEMQKSWTNPRHTKLSTPQTALVQLVQEGLFSPYLRIVSPPMRAPAMASSRVLSILPCTRKLRLQLLLLWEQTQQVEMALPQLQRSLEESPHYSYAIGKRGVVGASTGLGATVARASRCMYR